MRCIFSNFSCVNRGQKSLFLNEKDILSQSGYMFCHPDDGEIMMMCHQQGKIPVKDYSNPTLIKV